MRDGVLAGKTGYTSQAGYCYVCAWEKEGKTFIVSLLGCGWPNHKTYKWSDTKKLLDFGDYNYEYETYWKEPQTGKILVIRVQVEQTADQLAQFLIVIE